MGRFETNDLIKILKKYTTKDIAIALMNFELRNGEFPISTMNYYKFERVFEYYSKDKDNEHLTGMLNEVLQNAYDVFEELRQEDLKYESEILGKKI